MQNPAKKKHNTLILASGAKKNITRQLRLAPQKVAKKTYTSGHATGVPRQKMETKPRNMACCRHTKAKNIGNLRIWRAAGAPRQKYKRKMEISRAAGAPK